MSNFYKIPKSQLNVIIIFGIIGELTALINLGDYYEDSSFLLFLSFFIPFIVIFYFVGWKYHNKLNTSSKNTNKNIVNPVSISKVIFCTNCGEKNEMDSTYCIECGLLLK